MADYDLYNKPNSVKGEMQDRKEQRVMIDELEAEYDEMLKVGDIDKDEHAEGMNEIRNLKSEYRHETNPTRTSVKIRLLQKKLKSMNGGKGPGEILTVEEGEKLVGMDEPVESEAPKGAPVEELSSMTEPPTGTDPHAKDPYAEEEFHPPMQDWHPPMAMGFNPYRDGPKAKKGKA